MSVDEHQSGFVVFWARAMMEHTLALQKRSSLSTTDFCMELPDYIRNYFRFVATKLLQVTDLPGALAVCGILDKVDTQLPPLLSPLGRYLAKMLKDPAGDHAAVKQEMTLSTQSEVWRSALYRSTSDLLRREHTTNLLRI